MSNYSEQWPYLAEVTDGFAPHLVSMVGDTLNIFKEAFSLDVRNDYAEYTRFIKEYYEWHWPGTLDTVATECLDDNSTYP